MAVSLINVFSVIRDMARAAQRAHPHQIRKNLHLLDGVQTDIQ